MYGVDVGDYTETGWDGYGFVVEREGLWLVAGGFSNAD